MYETHICPKCNETVDIRCDGRILKEYEWCPECKKSHEEVDWMVRWFNHRFKMFTRRDLIVRDGGQCYLCKKGLEVNSRDMTIDHVVPISRGGLSTLINMRICCNECNNKKGDLLLDEYLNLLESD